MASTPLGWFRKILALSTDRQRLKPETSHDEYLCLSKRGEIPPEAILRLKQSMNELLGRSILYHLPPSTPSTKMEAVRGLSAWRTQIVFGPLSGTTALAVFYLNIKTVREMGGSRDVPVLNYSRDLDMKVLMVQKTHRMAWN